MKSEGHWNERQLARRLSSKGWCFAGFLECQEGPRSFVSGQNIQLLQSSSVVVNECLINKKNKSFDQPVTHFREMSQIEAAGADTIRLNLLAHSQSGSDSSGQIEVLSDLSDSETKTITSEDMSEEEEDSFGEEERSHLEEESNGNEKRVKGHVGCQHMCIYLAGDGNAGEGKDGAPAFMNLFKVVRSVSSLGKYFLKSTTHDWNVFCDQKRRQRSKPKKRYVKKKISGFDD